MRIEQLTFLRFVAALIVIMFHFGEKTSLAGLARPVLLAGPEMASFFFVLSGYILMVAYKDKKINPLRFYINRISRVWPTYFVGLLIISIFTYKDNNNSALAFLLHSFFLQSWIPPYPGSFNSPGWFLSTLMSFYIFFPFLHLFAEKTKTINITIIGCSVWVASHVALIILLNSSFYKGYPSISHDIIFYFPLSHFNAFLCGVIGGVIYKKHLEKIKICNFFSICFVAFAFCFTFYSLYVRGNYFGMKDVLGLKGLSTASGFLSPSFLILILALSIDKSFISKLFSLKPFVFLGDCSFTIYILQVPLVYCFNLLTRKFIQNGSDLYLYSFSAFLVITSIIFYKYLEKPFATYLNKINFG